MIFGIFWDPLGILSISSGIFFHSIGFLVGFFGIFEIFWDPTVKILNRFVVGMIFGIL